MTKNEIIERLDTLGVTLSREQKRMSKASLQTLLSEHDDTSPADTTPADTPPADTPHGDNDNDKTPDNDNIEPVDNQGIMDDVLNGGGVVDDKHIIDDDSADANVAKIIDKPKRKPRAPKAKSKKALQVEGAILIAVIDFIFPTAISVVAKIIGYQVDASSLMLDSEEVEKLAPYADDFAESVSLNLNPMTGFILMSSLAYLPKAFIVISNAPKTIKNKK